MEKPDSRQILPGITLSVEGDGEWVTSTSPEPDPNWKIVDSAGHGHFCGSTGDLYPTLEWVVLPCTMGHGEDCTAEGGFYRCKLCLEKILPGTRMPEDVYVPGPITYTMTVNDERSATIYSFGADQWKQVFRAVRETIAKNLGSFEVSKEIHS